MATEISLQADVIIVGSGPGGASLARELARAGGERKVLLLERGVDQRPRAYYGTYLGALLYTDRASFLYTQEGLNIIRPFVVGGATTMYTASSAPPPAWLKNKYGIDLDQAVSETVEELEIAPLPPELRGRASTRLAQAAQALGYDWQPLPKFMRPSRSANFDCGATCMLGCHCGAKWTAAEYVDEALAAGAELRTRARVEKVLFEDGHVTGVRGRLNGRSFVAHAERVVLAAGGIGTPRILQASGFPGAGQGMTMDTTLMVYGWVEDQGIGHEPPMTWAWEDVEAGYMLSTLIDPWLNYPLAMARKGWKELLSWSRWNHMLGVMIKLRDEVSGGVFPDGRISKPMTGADRERLAEAVEVSRKILVEAGAGRGDLLISPLRGTHPSGTVRLGAMLDSNLQTEIEGLYVCDASTFPEALGRPTVLTIIGLGKRLATHLLQEGI
jgi:choline dehydrogenase-like flavoprotein